MPRMEPDLAALRNQIIRLGISQKSVAEALGWHQSRLSRFLNGKSERPTIPDYMEVKAVVAKMAAERMARPDTRLMERGGADFEHFPDAELDRPMTSEPIIPVYGLVGAASGDSIHLDHSAVVRSTPRHPAQGERAGVFALEVWSESMSPRYEPGELVYCIRNQPPKRGQDCVIEMRNGDAFLKIYEGQRNSVVFTRQLNPDSEVRYEGAKVKALHAVVGRG